MTPGLPTPPEADFGDRPKGVNVTCGRGPEALAEMASEWVNLADAHALYSTRHAWYRSYVRALESRPEDLRVFAVRRSAQVVALLPLRRGSRRVRGMTLRTLELPWHPEMAVTDLVAAPEGLDREAAEALVASLSREGLAWDALVFRGVSDTSAAYGWSLKWPRSVRLPMAQRHHIRLDRPYEEALAGFSKNFRGNLRKARNKLRAAEGVEFVHAPEDADLSWALGQFLDVEASGWKGDRGTAIRTDPARVRFYEELVEALAPGGACEINLLTVGGRPAAGQFCVKGSGVMHLLKIGYDEEFAALAPGNMLLEDLLERCFARGIKEVDLVTDAPWHTDWRPAAQPIYEVLLLNRTLRGTLAWLGHHVRQSLRRAFRQVDTVH